MNNITKTNTTIEEQQEMMINDKKFREQFAGRIEVLDKVKTLLLLPKINVVTMSQVADFYGVPVPAVKMCYKRHAAEIDEDVTKMLLVTQMRDLTEVTPFYFRSFEQSKTGATVVLKDGTEISMTNRGVRCFSKRAVLRIGMLLQDSDVAREVRNQLLNIGELAEQVAPTIVTQTLNEEQRIMMDVGQAFASGDPTSLLEACTKMMDFKNRHIKALQAQNDELTEKNESLETTNQLLADHHIKWTNRATINRLINCLAPRLGYSHGQTWCAFYKHLNYRYGINLKARATKAGKPNAALIDYIRDNEWKQVEQTFGALLTQNNINAEEFYKHALPKIGRTDLVS